MRRQEAHRFSSRERSSAHPASCTRRPTASSCSLAANGCSGTWSVFSFSDVPSPALPRHAPVQAPDARVESPAAAVCPERTCPPGGTTARVTGTLRIPARIRPERRSVLLSRRGRGISRSKSSSPWESAGPARAKLLSAPGDRIEGERGDAKVGVRRGHAISAGAPAMLPFSYVSDGKTSFLYHVGPEVAFASGWGDAWYPVVEGVGGKGERSPDRTGSGRMEGLHWSDAGRAHLLHLCRRALHRPSGTAAGFPSTRGSSPLPPQPTRVSAGGVHHAGDPEQRVRTVSLR
jgi:hypothetical protein